MAISARTPTTNSSAGATSLAVNAPASLADGDVVVIVANVAGGGLLGTIASTGFTNVVQIDNGNAIRLALLRKVITNAAGEPASYTVTWGGTSRAVGLLAEAYAGVDTTTPEDVAGVTRTGFSQTLQSNASGITTATDHAWMLFCTGLQNATAIFNFPTGFTDRAQIGGSACHFSDKDLSPAGASGVISETITGGVSKNYATILIALRPAASGTTYTDTGSATSVEVGSGADEAILLDTGSAVSILAGSGADAPTFADAGSATGVLTGSGADAPTFVDAGSAISVLTGAGADAATLVDTGTGVLIAVGSGADSGGNPITTACAVLSQRARARAALTRHTKPIAAIAIAPRRAALSRTTKATAVLARHAKPIATIVQRLC